ncbi:MAG: flagellar basal body-associated FliL family protein [Bdellovibrionales bacterium]
MAEEDKEEASPKNAESAEGSEEQGQEEGLEPPKRGLGKKKLIIIAAVGGVLLLGAGVGAGLFFGGFFNAQPEVSAEGDPDTAHNATASHENGASAHGDSPKGEHGEGEASNAPVFLPLGDILVNLTSTGKRPNFLKIKISLELASEQDKTALEALKPRIIDNFQVYLRELRVDDLRGSAGLYRLREELLLRVNEAAQPIRIRDVLFQEMLVQ